MHLYSKEDLAEIDRDKLIDMLYEAEAALDHMVKVCKELAHEEEIHEQSTTNSEDDRERLTETSN